MAMIESLTAEAIIAMFNQGTWPQDFPVLTSDLTSIGSALPIDVSMASSLTLSLKNSGTVTMAVGTFVFEASLDSTTGTDGTWFAIQASRSNANQVDSNLATPGLAAGSGLAFAYRLSVAAYRWVRVRTTATVTASALATWTAVRGAYATEPLPAIQTHPVTGSGTFDTKPIAGTNYGLTSAASTNAAVVRNAAAQLFEISVFNPTAAIIYVKLYNKTTAPTVGTDVPIITIPVPINGLVALEFGAEGKRFSTGIGIAITAGPLATDVAAVAVGAQVSATYI